MRRTRQPVTVAVTLASLPRPRLSSRIPKTQSIWKAGSVCGGRGARCVSTDTSNALGLWRKAHRIVPGEVAPNEMMATVPGSSTLRVPEATTQKFNKVLGLQPEKNEKELYAIFKADSLSRFYVPAVMMGHDSPPPPSSRTVHIIGTDEKTQFVAHALHGVYDSVQMLNGSKDRRYVNVTGNLHRSHPLKSKAPWRDRNHVIADKKNFVNRREGHISNLVVGGRPSEAIAMLESVRHRVDDRTAICYLSDGLGVAEAANNAYFQDEETRPSIVLGHFSSPVAFNRNTKSVRVMKPKYTTSLTGVQPLVEGREDHLSETTWLRTQSMLQKFATADLLKARGMELEGWMSFKIPALMFSSVVDPVCVLLDRPYKDLMRNDYANSLMDHLLAEIADAVATMPEVRKSDKLQWMLREGHMKKKIMSQIWGKKDAPSKMALQVRNGKVTDIDYLNGFFKERGERAGLRMPANTMIINMVKAKQESNLQKVRSHVPFEEITMR